MIDADNTASSALLTLAEGVDDATALELVLSGQAMFPTASLAAVFARLDTSANVWSTD